MKRRSRYGPLRSRYDQEFRFRASRQGRVAYANGVRYGRYGVFPSLEEGGIGAMGMRNEGLEEQMRRSFRN